MTRCVKMCSVTWLPFSVNKHFPIYGVVDNFKYCTIYKQIKIYIILSISKHFTNRTLRPASLHIIINIFWGIWIMTWRKYLNCYTDYKAVPHISSRNGIYSIHSNSKRIQWTKHNKQNMKISNRSNLIHVNKIKISLKIILFWCNWKKCTKKMLKKQG